jgi:hypothetical protein
MLIDVANSGDRNVIEKKPRKYEDLTIEIQRAWNVKTKVIPVIMAQLGQFQSHLENTLATYREITKLRNYRKQPYWALHTYCGKC